MIELSDDKVKSLLREVVDEFGRDYVYKCPHADDSCLYVHKVEDGFDETKPGCIVAQVLHRAGVSLEYMERHEGRGANILLFALENDAMLSISSKSAYALRNIQCDQDLGISWGEALDSTMNRYSSF